MWKTQSLSFTSAKFETKKCFVEPVSTFENGTRTFWDLQWLLMEFSPEQIRTAIHMGVSHSAANNNVSVGSCGHDGCLTSFFYPASISSQWLYRRGAWPRLFLAVHSVVSNHPNSLWRLPHHAITAHLPSRLYISPSHQFLNYLRTAGCIWSVLMQCWTQQTILSQPL